jgi:ATP-dependent DNA ligase
MRPYSGRRKFDIIDPIVEPFWSGVRVLIHFELDEDREAAPHVAIIEDLGADLSEELPDVAAAVGRGIVAIDAVVDGVISRQVGLDGIGAAAIPEVRGGTSSILMRNNAELTVVPRGPGADIDETVEGFIAFDLLRLDGTSLLEVPLLERKRLLESVIDQSELVRASVHARPPFESWITTWKSLGLRGGMLKAANSRYQPGGDSVEWRVVESVGRRG